MKMRAKGWLLVLALLLIAALVPTVARPMVITSARTSASNFFIMCYSPFKKFAEGVPVRTVHLGSGLGASRPESELKPHDPLRDPSQA